MPNELELSKEDTELGNIRKALAAKGLSAGDEEGRSKPLIRG